MSIVLTPIGAPKGGDQTLQHDLNFQQGKYESTHSVVRIAFSAVAALRAQDRPTDNGACATPPRK